MRQRRLKHSDDGNKKKNSCKEKHSGLLPISFKPGASAEPREGSA
jgi:hypothetical protein